jgi:hypothetical protein
MKHRKRRAVLRAKEDEMTEEADENVTSLTKADRSDAKRCGARFAHGMYHGPGKQPWVRDGKMVGVTETMLGRLLAEVYSVAYDAGVADTREAIVTNLRARGDLAGTVLANALERA